MAGVAATAIPNPDLTWYTAETYNLGLDFDLWNQKLSGTFEVFKRKRSGLLATSSTVVPGTVGASLPQENLNSDQTFGWEISLNHRNRVAGVNYWVGGQISATKNRWDYRLDSQASNSMDAWRRRDVSGRNKDIWFSYEEGGRFTSYEQIRYHNVTGGGYGQGTLPGDYYYKDWNGDGVINGDDNHPMATYNLPVFNYGFVMGAEWKGVDISLNWQGAAGVYNFTMRYLPKLVRSMVVQCWTFTLIAGIQLIQVMILLIRILSGYQACIQLQGTVSVMQERVLKIPHICV